MSSKKKSSSQTHLKQIKIKKSALNNQRLLIDAVNEGNALMQQDRFDEACNVYAKAVEINPKDVVALSNLGAALVRSGRLAEAKIILEYALEIDPKNSNVRINLGSVLQADKDFHGAIKNALEAITIEPTSARAFNNLGCAFGCVLMLDEALHAYQTAQQLDPTYLEAHLNVSMTLVDMGKAKEGLASYVDLLNKIPNNRKELKQIVKFYMSFLYLQEGNLQLGWDYYESGFNTSIPLGAARSPNRKFPYPQWAGEDLNGRKILIWREQGIGDEILFSSCLVDLMNINVNATFECSTRLVETYSRSFPGFQVRSEKFNLSTGLPLEEEFFDYHIPLGSLPKMLRKKITDFEKQRPFVKVNPQHKLIFEDRLKSYSFKKIIGICWRSGLLDPLRNKSYTSLTDWKTILSDDQYVFVNLQYGDCESELQEVENSLKIKILRWNDIDLKNDLDKVFALMSCLDCVISAPTAVNCMAGSLGIRTIYLGNKGWPNLGAPPGVYPWYPNTISCDLPLGEPAALSLLQVPKILNHKLFLKSDSGEAEN